MEGAMDVNEVLDYAVFQISSSQNRYETFVCCQGKTEKLNGGLLDQLALHLPKAKEIQEQQTTDSFRLHVLEGHGDSTWFTKSTIARFLNIVSVPEALKNANAIENEMSQLEDTRNFQLALYAKDHPEQFGGGGADVSSMKMVGVTHKLTNERSSSDATKNELLRAMDLRITALKEELSSTFHKAMGATCSSKQISDVMTFAQYFGAIDLRDSLVKYLDLCFLDENTDLSIEQSPLDDISNNSENIIDGTSLRSSQINPPRPASNGISPAKIAQAERQSLTESEESSDSGNEEEPYVERSRPMVRSATPRRSASPMRRVQIGRSGSRRSTALTIKSLGYFPPRDRVPFNRDADGSKSGDEESEEQPKRTDNAVRRMSVQDAISLFESKQKDQTSDASKRKATVEASVSTNKSVLRRWSAGMGDSFSPCTQENGSNTGTHITSDPVVGVEEKKSTEDKTAPDLPEDVSNQNQFAESPSSSEVKKIASPPIIEPAEVVIPQSEETNDRATSSAEWNRQKEAELNEMLMKMMENKPGKYRAASAGHQDVANEQRGGFYSQYKEKRDEKLRAENAGRQASKVAQFKVMQETLEQSKAQMTSKSTTKGKQDSVNHSQRPRRNSSPPVLTKKDASALTRKEASKPAGTRKASPKSSPLSSVRNSSTGSLPRTVGTPPARPSPGSSTATPPTRRKPQPSPSPTRPSPRTERQPQPKEKKGRTVPDSKPSLKVKEDTRQKTPTRNRQSTKPKNPLASGDDSVETLTKPSFYSKVTKKSTVVPLESKPFLKKGTGIGPGVGPVIAKTKVSQSDESLKDSGSLTQTEEKESISLVAESTAEAMESCEQVQPEPINSVEANLEIPEESELNHEKADDSSQAPAAENSFMHSVEPVSEIQSDVDMGISSAAWVEVEHQDISSSLDNCLPEAAISPELVPIPSSSPRVRHSLSQMLQADTSEPEIVEWGNAENPPALVYQKDAPKGLKRLLKFARKSKGEANVTGWASPSVFSEGEDDSEESKAASKRNPDALLRKAALQTKGYGQQKALLSESFDGGNSSKRATDYRGMHSILSGQASMSGAEKLREGHSSATSTSTKAARSFFSLSTFRSGKSSETKLR
ncbi:hypothetical protein IHE45_12G057700 [Dioscorea alata]|uniref:Uncharacterized protein n=2 Tax=Dioscorea alata TaxID=55571 RepID=A0ACB7V2I2_DIOAL|nr:hypothetical protein IHE45_12G057700 [Dioscorea alata]KAH7667433.1 hypothetical protein IHE45_12G057700 [Dioscorea alata]